jgi:hypothetical protein
MPPWQAPVLMSMQPAHGVQVPLTQVLPIMQLVQAAPPAPQREGVVLVMQTPVALQQPLAHVVALQVPPSGLPPPPPVALPPPVVPPVQRPPNSLF